MNKIEKFALDAYLLNYPSTLTFQQIIQELRRGKNNPDIEIWDMVKGQPDWRVGDAIVDLYIRLNKWLCGSSEQTSRTGDITT